MDAWNQPFPELEFAGGRLRQWRIEDAPVLVQAWQDPEIARWNAVPPDPTVDTASRWIAGVEKRRGRRLAADFAVEIHDPGAIDRQGVVGEVGLSGFSAAHRGALIGYWLLADARGHGVAASAVRAVAAWAHEALDVQVIVARCDAANDASQAVAERAGFAHEASDDTGAQLWRSHRTSPEG